MKIFEVIPTFNPLGGAENFVLNISISLKAKGHNITVVSLYSNVNDYCAKELAMHDIEIVYLGKRKGFDFNAIKMFYKLCVEKKPDVVHLHLNTFLTAYKAIKKTHIRFIYTMHTYVSNQTFGSKKKPLNILLKHLFKKQYLYPVTISNSVDKSFKAYFGNISTSIIYNGIDLKKFKFEKNSVDYYDFISIGSFNDIKNNLFMIKCFEKLLKEGRKITYVILGDGKNYNECFSYCEEHGLKDYVHFTGFVDNTFSFLSHSGCLLLASHWEGNPLVVNEAIACGKWTIANDVGGVKDLVNSTCGYLTKAEDETDFIDKMRKFLENKNDIKSNIIPCAINENRKRVDLEKTTDEYVLVMKGSL